MLERPVARDVDRRLESRHHRERGPRLALDLAHLPVDVGPVEATVDRDHLAVEPVQRSQPEVAVLGQLGEREVALVSALQQRPDRRGLEQHVRLPLRLQFPLPQRLHMQRPDPPLVQHSLILPGRQGARLN